VKIPIDTYQFRHLLSPRASGVYDYLLSCIEGNDWITRAVADMELRHVFGIAPAMVSRAKRELLTHGVIQVAEQINRGYCRYNVLPELDVKERLKEKWKTY